MSHSPSEPVPSKVRCPLHGPVGSDGLCYACVDAADKAEQRPSKELVRNLRYCGLCNSTGEDPAGGDCRRCGGSLSTEREAAAEIERLQAREREAFRLANAATYLVAPKYSLHAELKAFMDGQVGKPDDSTPKEIENARRTAEYWKAEHLAGNAEIDRQQAQIATLKGYIERTALAGYRCAECAARLTAEPRVPGCIHDSAPTTLCQVCYPSPELGISSDRAYELGWRSAAEWAGRDDLIAGIGSPVYEQDRAKAFGPAQLPGARQ